jgi:hypothetical protein
MVRPDGVRRDLRLVGHGRDIGTAADGAVTVLDEGSMEVIIDFLDAVAVRHIETSPVVPGLENVLRRSAATGFRAAVDAAIGRENFRGRPIYQLLDDIPVATLVSGYAVGFAGGREPPPDDDRPWKRAEGMAELQVADLCAGFQAGGTIMRARAEGTRGGGGHVTGPIASSVERPDDHWAWHEFPPLGADAMRRRRRIDVWPDHDPSLVRIEAFFRDSHMGEDGYETIIHEYIIDAGVDTETMTFVHAQATPRVLPWYECPQAAASGGRLVGLPVQGLRPTVRAEFLGPTTCTHLNDTLRALEDVDALIAALPDTTIR